jgi:cytochrome oxidase Cu insertion factor (SCO1/SenC/PrrC family)
MSRTDNKISEEETLRIQSRRKLLAGFSLTAAASLPALALGSMPTHLIEQRAVRVIDRARNQGFPDTRVTAHTGEVFRFYDDLVHDRVVLINFMSIKREPVLPITRNMAQLVKGFGDRIGRDIHAFSISYDEQDTPERLAEFAKSFNAPTGWKFLSATPEDVISLGYRLYRTEGRFRTAMHSDLIHFGNASVGLWGTMSAQISDVDFAMQRVASVMPRNVTASAGLRRAGPRRVEAEGPVIHNRDCLGNCSGES